MADADKGWLARAKQGAKNFLGIVEMSDQIRQDDYSYGVDAVGVDILLGSGKRTSRSRVQLYQKLTYMMQDPIVSTGLRLHVTMALGGHETTGDTVFIERKPDIPDGDQRAKIVEELVRDLSGILNKNAHQTCFKAAGYGDAYGRLYVKEGVGVVDIDTGDLFHPPLVQSYERANTTAGFIVSDAKRGTVKLTRKQLVRMKMQRMEYVPQTRALDNAMRQNIAEDDIDKLTLMASTVGGSFLHAAEEAFDNLAAAIVGLVGQRIMSSIDETMVGVNFEGVTLEQRKLFMGSITNMLKGMKDRAAQQINEGKYSVQRNFHVIPTTSDKQITQISSFQGAAGSSSLTVDDVMFHARLLAGSFGIDLSMLGFADQLTGGLGEGGFNQTSSQAAERAGIIRTAYTEYCHAVIDVHMYTKYGSKYVFEDGDRPYAINFFGSIAALEAKEQQSRERKMNAGALLVTTVQQLRDIGMPEKVNEGFFASQLGLDADFSKVLAKGLANAKPPEPAGFGAEGGDQAFIPPAGGSNDSEEE